MTNHYFYYKEQTPCGLNTILISNPFLKENFKCIPSVINLLRIIGFWNNMDKDKDNWSSITSNYFKNRFGNLYTQIIHSLVELELLKVSYYCRKKHTYGKDDNGECFSYKITDKCYSLLSQNETEYLYRLFTDPKEIRKNQKRISRSGFNKVIYDDIRNDIKQMLDGIDLDFNELLDTLTTLTNGKRFTALYCIRNIKEKRYTELKHNTSDNRIATPYTALPKEIRHLLTVNGKKPVITIDVRSCHPSLFAKYISELFPTDETLNAEVEKWNGIFLSQNDPKTYLSNLLNIPRTEIKEIMLEYFNGQWLKNKHFRKFNYWLSSNFPQLYKRWKTTNIKQTGVNLSKKYETKIMLDPLLFKQCKVLGFTIGQEYDGFTLFGDNSKNVDEVISFLKQRTNELLDMDLIYSVN